MKLLIATTLCLLALPAQATLEKGSKNDDDSRKKAAGAENAEGDRLVASTFSGLAFRSIGPALESGRVVDIAVNPKDPSEYFVAAASGGVWKTTNAGTTWTPVFDDQGSYSIGCITIDPNNPLIVWVGTGENNSQRSVSFGDGVYKSLDGGRSWKRVGLPDSEHIGKILVHPNDSNTVYVAAQGPLWSAGGDRGLYKTTDGGATWSRVLEISDNTGVTDVVMDPRDPDVLLAASYQRRRRVWTLIDGGPESALYRTTDGGKTWNKIEQGLPKEELGRVGLAISPVDPNVVYAIVEAANDAGGFFASDDAGLSWEKRSGYVSDSPQYYQELVADPEKVDRVYSMDTYIQVTDDGGRTFRRAGEKWKHVDNHALWIDPRDPRHLIDGCDGGVYESFDRAKTWSFKTNLPLTQFYRVTVDNSLPFYRVFGGTQDNASLGGPSRNTSVSGIPNSDWFVTTFGDGFETQVDPVDPEIIYAQSQYGGLVRYDHRSGEQLDIQPQPAADEPPLRWNWDSALLISPHSPTRLYFAANRVFRSDDRGDSWRPISPDLTRQLDRNALEVMGEVWSVDAVAKNQSTSFYGNVVSLSESPLVEGLLYAGTDDGLIQTTSDGGESWRAVASEDLPGAPKLAYVSSLQASQQAPDTVFAALDAHKDGDFEPYLYRSDDRGVSWRSIRGDLPERGTVYAVAQDHVKPELLFAGTEYGVFFTIDGGQRWIQLNGGLPTIAVRDLEIQRRENDLVLATFGRGFYVLDDYSPLRTVSEDQLDAGATLFPTRDALAFVERTPLGLDGKSMQGHTFFTAPNPPFGAIFTYYLSEELASRKEQRQEAEKAARKEGKDVGYPDWETLRAETREEAPAVLLTVSDLDGNVVKRVAGSTKEGFHRVAWDLRYPPVTPTVPGRSEPEGEEEEDPFSNRPTGPMAVPGDYQVTLSQVVDGETKVLDGPDTFHVVPLGQATLGAADRAALEAFQRRTASLQRVALGARRAAEQARDRIALIRRSLLDTPGEPAEPLLAEARRIERALDDLLVRLSGDRVVQAHSEPVALSVLQRIGAVVGGSWTSTAAPTQTHRDNLEIARAALDELLPELRQLVEVDLEALEDQMEEREAPWTPGRIPSLPPEP